MKRKRIRIHKISIPVNPQVEKDLEKLYPDENRLDLCREYYVGKLKRSFMICLAGSMLAILLVVQAKGDLSINEKGELIRGEYGEEAKEVEVQCVRDKEVQDFKIEVGAQLYDKEEIDEIYQNFRVALEQLVLGGNASLQEVTQDLYLCEKYEGYPFLLEWESENEEVIHKDGLVERKAEVLGKTSLTAKICYEEWEWQETFPVTVLPLELTEEERFRKELETLLQNTEQDSRTQKTLKLPEQWQGENLIWKEKSKNHSWVIGVIAVGVGVLVYGLADKDLHNNAEKRKRQMKREYPEVIHKLTLYLGAGMTIRGSFLKMAEEYATAKKKGKKESPVYEEILHVCRELQAGVSEGNAYEHFGKRTGVQEYIRLGTLLIQNLKKGNSMLLQRLREEAEKASLEQLQYGKILCEEAVTKLLFPMVLMLLVVMLMIMIPAFSGMGI